MLLLDLLSIVSVIIKTYAWNQLILITYMIWCQSQCFRRYLWIQHAHDWNCWGKNVLQLAYGADWTPLQMPDNVIMFSLIYFHSVRWWATSSSIHISYNTITTTLYGELEHPALPWIYFFSARLLWSVCANRLIHLKSKHKVTFNGNVFGVRLNACFSVALNLQCTLHWPNNPKHRKITVYELLQELIS